MSESGDGVASHESAEAVRRSGWHIARRIAGPAIRLLIVAAVIEFALLPQIAGARKSFNLLGGISPLWMGVAIVAQCLSIVAYARLTQIAVDAPGVSYWQLLRIDLSTLAVSHVVPAGSAVGIGLGYRLLTRSGVSSERAVTGKALQTVGSAVVLNVLLGAGLVAALVLHGSNPLYAPMAAIGLALIIGAGVIGIILAHGESRLTTIVVRALDRIPRVDADSGRRLISALAGTIRRLAGDRRFLFRLTVWATLNWVLEAFALWACVRAFGHTLGPVGLLVAYGLANVAAALPITPGGLGIVEGILVPTLVAFDTTRGVAVLGVLAFRLLSFWLPIPIGFASYARLEWQLRHRVSDEPDHDLGDDGLPMQHLAAPGEPVHDAVTEPRSTVGRVRVSSSQTGEDSR